MNTSAKHFSPRASLAAIGLRLRRLRLLEAITATVHVPQKTVRHTPAEKLYDAFVAILAGAHGLSEHSPSHSSFVCAAKHKAAAVNAR